MSVIRRASSGYLIRHPWQLGMAILGISIGVAVMVAVDLANESSRAAFRLSMDTINGTATHQIVGGPGGLDETLYSALRTRHGISDIAPVVSGSATMDGQRMQLLGVDLFAERTFRPFSAPDSVSRDLAGDAATDDAMEPMSLVRAMLTVPGSLMLSHGTAASRGLSAGDPVNLSVGGHVVEGSFVASFGADDGSQLDGIVVADISTAQEWLGMSGRLSRIDVRLAPGDDGVALAAILPPGARLLSADGRTETAAQMSQAFMTNLTAMSLLAMLVGMFLIYNSVAFAVLQRRDLLATLRALGLTRRQVFLLIATEAAVLGIVGAALGVLLGLWLGDGLVSLVARSVSDHFYAVTVSGILLSPWSLAKGVLAGLLATMFAAAVPALEAARLEPSLAMSRSVAESRTGNRAPPAALGGILLCVAAACLMLVSGRSLVAGLTALFMLIMGYALVVPLAVRVVSAASAGPVGKLFGTVARLAVGGVAETLSRTAVAVVALAVAISATIGVSIMVDSFRQSVVDWLDSSLQSDLYVGAPRGSLDPGLIEDIAALPGVRRYSTSRRSWLEVEGARMRLLAIAATPESYRGTQIRGASAEAAWRGFENGDVLVSDAFSYVYSVEAGDTLTLPTGEGPAEFRIAGVYRSYDVDNGIVMMSRQTYDRWFEDPGVDSIGLYLAPGTGSDQVGSAIRALAEGRQSVILSSNQRIRELSLRVFDRTFVITHVLYWLAVIVAVIGIFGAMLALQLERAREFGILRSVGLTPRETGVLVSAQAAFMGLLGGVLAIPLGLLMAWVLIVVINRRAFGWHIDVVLAPGPIAAGVLVAVAAAIAAGLYPAWRAARARPAALIHEE